MSDFATPSIIEVSCYKRSGDGQYWLRYPNGDKPYPSMFADARADAAAIAALNAQIRLGGAPAAAIAAAANLTTHPAAGSIKFNPGHYGDFNSVVFGSGALPVTAIPTAVKNEMNLIAPYPRVLGYQASIALSALEPTKGETDVSALYPNGFASGAALLKLMHDYLAAMTPPRRLIAKVQLGGFTSTHPGATDYSVIPKYIQTDATYGASGYRVSGVVTNVPAQHGWWGGDGNGHTYALCFHRGVCADRVTKMMQIISGYANDWPYFEGWAYEENSFVIGASSTNACPDFSPTNFTTNAENCMAAAALACPNTSVCYENTYGYDVPRTQAVSAFMAANRVDFGCTDSLGLTYMNAHGGAPYTWGAAIYVGLVPSGGTGSGVNYKAQNYAYFPEVQGTDMGAYGQFAGGYTKEDILAGFNTVTKPKKAYWCILPPGGNYGAALKPGSTWDAMGPWLNDAANALVNTSTPVNY